MDIVYKDKDISIVIKNITKGEILTEEEINNIVSIIKALKSNDYVCSCSNSKKENVTKKDFSTVKDQNRPVVRDRIPNQIDMSEIEIKKAVTEEPMLRCPSCGQATVIIVDLRDTYYLLRKITKDKKPTFEIVTELESSDIENIMKPKDAKCIDYNSDIMKIKSDKKFKGIDLNVNNDTDIICPVCGNTHKFNEWVDCFKNPVEFGFEYNIICDICGGECLEILKPNGKETIIKCEECGEIPS